MADLFDLPDIALGKIIEHLYFRDKVALSAVSKAGHSAFNAPDAVFKWGAIWGELRINVATKGVEVHATQYIIILVFAHHSHWLLTKTPRYFVP